MLIWFALMSPVSCPPLGLAIVGFANVVKGFCSINSPPAWLESATFSPPAPTAAEVALGAAFAAVLAELGGDNGGAAG